MVDAFAQAANLSDREISMLLHWDKHKMVQRYNRNYSGMELKARMLILRFLAIHDKPPGPWCSLPPLSLPDDPPPVHTLPLLPNQAELQQEARKSRTVKF